MLITHSCQNVAVCVRLLCVYRSIVADSVKPPESSTLIPVNYHFFSGNLLVHIIHAGNRVELLSLRESGYF